MFIYYSLSKLKKIYITTFNSLKSTCRQSLEYDIIIFRWLQHDQQKIDNRDLSLHRYLLNANILKFFSAFVCDTQQIDFILFSPIILVEEKRGLHK